MGADQDRRAWSAYGGEWRLVRIRYPWLWPPAWGWRPWAAAAVSVVGLVVAYGAARLAGAVGWVAPLEPAVFTVIVRALYVLAVLVAVAGGAWSSATLIRSVADLVTSSDRRSGLVLRVRLYGRSSRSTGRHYVAVDDGVSAVIRAWRIRPELASDLMVDEGDIAAATVTRQLRFVEGIGRA
jgi:hypothetical protein